MREARADLRPARPPAPARLRQFAACSGCSAHAAPAPRPWRRPASRPSTISGRLRSISRVTVNSSFMIGAGPFSRARSSAGFPAGDRHLTRNVLRKCHRFLGAVLHAQHGDGRAQPQEAHAVAALADDFLALRRQRQAVDFDHVVEHAGEYLHHLAIGLPIEARIVGERIDHEFGEIHRTQQARAVWRQRLLAAWIGGADVLRPPVVVHLVDPVDQDEAGFREIVGRGHDHVPHAARRQGLVDLAGDQALLVRDIASRCPAIRATRICEVSSRSGRSASNSFRPQRKGELPLAVALDRLHEFIGDQQRQIELPQAAVLALGANEFEHVGMADIEGAHLRAAPAAGRRHGEAHLVVDIHERQRAGGIGAGARDVGAARPQGREFVSDAAPRLQREPGFMNLVQNIVHRIADRAGYRAIDGRCGRLVFERAGVRGDAAGRNRAMAQRPQKRFVPLLAAALRFPRRRAHVRRACRYRPSTGRWANRPLRSDDISYPRCRRTPLEKECCRHLWAVF